MGTRKVQITGGNSFYITLPKKWIELHGITKNQNIGVFSSFEGNLLISPRISKEPLQKIYTYNVNQKTDSNFLFRLLLAAYLMGASNYQIESFETISSHIRDTVIDFVKYAYGLEITKETKTNITITNLITASSIHFTSAIQRMEILLNSMLENAMEAINKFEIQIAKEAINRDHEINHFHWLISRLTNLVLSDFELAHQLGIEIEKVSNYTVLSLYLELAGDFTVTILQNICQIIESGDAIPIKIKKLLVSKTNDALNLISEALDSFRNENLLYANQAIEKMKTISETTNQILKELNIDSIINKSNTAALTVIFISLERIARLGVSIAEMVMNIYTPTKLNQMTEI